MLPGRYSRRSHPNCLSRRLRSLSVRPFEITELCAPANQLEVHDDARREWSVLRVRAHAVARVVTRGPWEWRMTVQSPVSACYAPYNLAHAAHFFSLTIFNMYRCIGGVEIYYAHLCATFSSPYMSRTASRRTATFTVTIHVLNRTRAFSRLDRTLSFQKRRPSHDSHLACDNIIT